MTFCFVPSRCCTAIDNWFHQTGLFLKYVFSSNSLQLKKAKSRFLYIANRKDTAYNCRFFCSTCFNSAALLQFITCYQCSRKFCRRNGTATLTHSSSPEGNWLSWIKHIRAWMYSDSSHTVFLFVLQRPILSTMTVATFRRMLYGLEKLVPPVTVVYESRAYSSIVS